MAPRRTTSWGRSAARHAGFRAVACALALASPVTAAWAALGGAVSSVASDRKALAADDVKTTESGTYQRHAFTTPDGTDVREYSTPNAGVFAVDFAGPTMPDLKTVLGTHYDAYVAAAKAARRGVNHRVFSFASDGVVMTVTKLPRGFAGQAHLPAVVPAGVDIQTLR